MCKHINERCSTPAIVCISLACEVYIKTILTYLCIKFKRQHGLTELYNLMPKEYQEKIESATNLKVEMLEPITDTFVDYRYLYEKDIEILFSYTHLLVTTRNILREECCQLVHSMTWDEYKAKMRW